MNESQKGPAALRILQPAQETDGFLQGFITVFTSLVQITGLGHVPAWYTEPKSNKDGVLLCDDKRASRIRRSFYFQPLESSLSVFPSAPLTSCPDAPGHRANTLLMVSYSLKCKYTLWNHRGATISAYFAVYLLYPNASRRCRFGQDVTDGC